MLPIVDPNPDLTQKKNRRKLQREFWQGTGELALGVGVVSCYFGLGLMFQNNPENYRGLGSEEVKSLMHKESVGGGLLAFGGCASILGITALWRGKALR